MVAQNVLPRATFRRTARQDRRQPADHLAALVVGASALLLTDPQLLEGSASSGDLGAELLTVARARGGGIGDPSELGRLHVESSLKSRGVRPRKGPRPSQDQQHGPEGGADRDYQADSHLA